MPLPRIRGRAAAPLVAVAAALLLAACATSPESPASSAATAKGAHATLKARAAQRWQHIIEHQPAKAWDFLTPGYRETMGKVEYAARMASTPMRYESAEVTKVDCAQPDNCRLFVVVGYTLLMPSGGGGAVQTVAPIKETWLQLQGIWYYLPGADG